MNVSERLMSDFLSNHRLPPEFRSTAEKFYLPLASQLPKFRDGKMQLLLGINGAQGTGKSTLASFLQAAVESMFDWNVAVLSIDDFYYTKAERLQLARDVHPLLATRGVPGTHDIAMLANQLERLQQLDSDEHLALPRFDKATDDRAEKSRWPVVSGPIDLVILEGWCVGTKSQRDADLVQPVNALERVEDADGNWRNYVNEQLKSNYEPIFSQLDALVFIRAPSFDAILRWRLEQEEKLADASPSGSSGLMSRKQIERFIQFYERLTRVNLATIPNRAAVVIELDDTHSVLSIRYAGIGNFPL